MPSSRQRTRSGKSGAKAPQPDADASAEITAIKQLLNLAEIDDSDRAQRLLETLQTKSESLDLSTLDDDLIRNILMKFNVDNTTQRPSLVRKLKLIIDFSLPSFEGKTVKQLESKQTVELVIYHLKVTGYLPANKNNKAKKVLAEVIDEARKNVDNGKSYYTDLSCNEIMKKVKEQVKGYRYRRRPERITLVKNLQDAEGHYEDESDEWVRSEATTLIQLHVLWLLMNPNLDNVRLTMSKTELQEAIIELRNKGKQVPPPSAKSTLEEEKYGYGREKGRDPTPTKEEEAADSPHQAVNSGSSKGGGRDPPATTLHPSTSTFTTPKPKPNQGVNAKHSQRNEEEEVRGVVDDERDENTAGTPNATTASPLRGSIGSTDARAMNTQERTDSRVDDNSVVDSREGASMERNINLLTQFTIQCKTRIDQNEEGLGIEREKLELQKQEFKAHKQDYEAFKDGQRKCNEGQRKWNEGQEVFNENISDEVENLKEDTRKSARKVDKSARKVARAVHFLSKFHPGVELSSPESVTSTDHLNDSVEENERNDNIGVALSANESGEVLNPSRGLFGSLTSPVLGSSAPVSGEQNNSNRGELELVSNFDQNDASANESGRSSLFNSPQSSTPGRGLGLSRGTPQEVNSRRKSISLKHLSPSAAASPVTSAAAAAASSLPNASPNNSNASETDELVNVVSNDAEDEGGAANNVDTDRSGSVEAGAKDEDGGGEEEIDERFVALKNQLKDVVDRSDSTEADHLSALNALKGHVLRYGCVYDEDLSVILEHLQHSTNTEVYDAAFSIMTCFPHGVEEVTDTPITAPPEYNHGDVAVCGSGDCGQLGLGDSHCFDLRKLKVLEDLHGQNIIQLAAGGLHNLALSADGKVNAWGCNDEGSLGVLEPNEDGFLPSVVTGFYPSQYGPNGTEGLLDASGKLLPFEQRPEANIVQVFAGKTQSLALCSKGNLFTWGSFKENDSGQNFREEPPEDDPRPRISPGDMAKVMSGDEDIARLTVPLGKNNHPVHVTQMTQRVTAISSGGHINAAILQDTTLVTWGLGTTGEMARPVCEVTDDLDLITRERLTPHPVHWDGPLLKRTVLQVACGEFHLLVVSREGNNQLSVYSSGLNQYGQLGLGDTDNRHQLTKVEFFEGKGIEKVEGAKYASYFVGDANKKLYSVGRGDYGGLGITLAQPETEFCVSTPHRVPLVYDVHTHGDISEPTQNCIDETAIDEDKQPEIEQVAAGDSHVIVITKQGDVYSWGFGESGQCGQNKRDSSVKNADITLPQKMNLTMKKVTYKVMYASGGAQHSAFIINSDRLNLSDADSLLPLALEV